MVIGVVTAYRDEDASSRRVLAECRRVGEAAALDPADLRLTLDGAAVAIEIAGAPATAFDCFVLVRGLSARGDPDVQFEVYRALEAVGRPVLSRIDALLSAQDKLRTSVLLSRAGVATPAAAAVQTPADARALLARMKRAVAKPLCGSLGEGVELLEDGPAGHRRADELLEQRGSLYLQSWVDHGGCDVRAFVVGGVVEAAIERQAVPGDFRTNVAVGGQTREIELGPRARALAAAAARALGLDWAGVDLAPTAAGPTVLEVNGNPSWDAILAATGRDMAVPIVAHATRRARRAAELGASEQA